MQHILLTVRRLEHEATCQRPPKLVFIMISSLLGRLGLSRSSRSSGRSSFLGHPSASIFERETNGAPSTTEDALTSITREGYTASPGLGNTSGLFSGSINTEETIRPRASGHVRVHYASNSAVILRTDSFEVWFFFAFAPRWTDILSEDLADRICEGPRTGDSRCIQHWR